jgi:hypothetical protein
LLGFNGFGLLGYMDEARLWNVALTQDQIRADMFCSSRGFSAGANTGLIGAWNFDGNLINFSSTTGINGSFGSGGTNNCRFSAFSNETSSGAPSTSFLAHTTVVNRTTTLTRSRADLPLSTFQTNCRCTTEIQLLSFGARYGYNVELFLSITLFLPIWILS